MASASIAQVHRARLRVRDEKTGKEEVKEVAVKVQKPAIKKQMNLDLWSYQRVGRSDRCSQADDRLVQYHAVHLRMGIPNTLLLHSAICRKANASRSRL